MKLDSKKYDVHVATEGVGDRSLKQKLCAMGYVDDRLVSRSVTFLRGHMVSACPLIDLHVSRKNLSLPEVKEDVSSLTALLRASGAVGYLHAEFIAADVTLRGSQPRLLPWPLAPFDSRLREINKRWDLHISIPQRLIEPELLTVLSASGMYYIDLLKAREKEEVYRIYTIQGVSSVQDGKRIFDIMVEWFTAVGVPQVDLKFEITTHMVRFGDPLIVPPTIE